MVLHVNGVECPEHVAVGAAQQHREQGTCTDKRKVDVDGSRQLSPGEESQCYYQTSPNPMGQ